MLFNMFLRRAVLRALPILATILWAGPALAQVKEVNVGVTPTCPYGLGGCWAGAYDSLNHLDGVESVTTVPNTYNCTADVTLKGQDLPDPEAWSKQFHSRVGQAYEFRGVEVTVVGTIARKGDGLALTAPGLKQPITLAPLRHKLQWNFNKGAARQPEPDEKAAYDQLAAKLKESNREDLKVQLTGPLRKGDSGTELEAREFFILMRGADPHGRY